ncbi:hypothetical protein IC762_03200 [Bradyrhizobium genosp. L]|uniref:hypothetical protein n=1 Tax=Bradyrhizobium genosp. L TaxID=83637 RepID=UPI0018A2A882|nr:hypothetical protein [Bradyrhizobium genosp. L]QPF85355.1 hypothetical protein IC762_03200 [Bradyrhizobium genosp. L]
MTGGISALLRESRRALAGWICVIGAALIGFWLTRGGPYHDFAAGVLLSASTLFIAMALFEGVWRLFVGPEA